MAALGYIIINVQIEGIPSYKEEQVALNEMWIYLNIKKLHMTPYDPQTNGAVERVHQTLERMIGKLDSK